MLMTVLLFQIKYQTGKPTIIRNLFGHGSQNVLSHSIKLRNMLSIRFVQIYFDQLFIWINDQFGLVKRKPDAFEQQKHRPHNLISIFVNHFLESITPKPPTCKNFNSTTCLLRLRKLD